MPANNPVQINVGPGPNYTPDQKTVTAMPGVGVTFNPPDANGFLLCCDPAIEGKKSHKITASKTFNLSGVSNGTVIDYGTYAPTATCPASLKGHGITASTGNSINVNSGGGKP